MEGVFDILLVRKLTFPPRMETFFGGGGVRLTSILKACKGNIKIWEAGGDFKEERKDLSRFLILGSNNKSTIEIIFFILDK